MTQSIIRSTNPNDTQLSFSKIQAYIGVWLDNTCKQETYDSIKTALLDVFDSLKTYTEFWKCLTYINKDRPGKIIFIVSYEIGKNLIPLIFRQDPSPIEYIYVYSIDETQQHNWDFQKPDKLRDGFTTVHRLIKQIIIDIREFNERAETIAPKITPSTSITTTFDDAGGTTTSNDVITSRRHDHCLPPPSFFSENIQNTSIKDLNADSAWFIQFQLLVEILIRMTNSEQAKTDIVFVCREHYKEDKSQQTKIDRFEKEADDLSKTIYWYTRESFIVHLLNKVCGTEDADDLYKFRLFIRNLHYRIVEMNNDNLTVQLKRKEVVLYRGKRVAASTFENFRNSINGLVVMKGFLSTTMDPKVAEFFAGGDVTQMGFVNVLFKLKIDNWEKCKPAAAIDPAYSAMEDEQEVLFSIGTIWRILNVNELSGS
ncbi:unnamed protein product [Adineta steineri]|nr:unnamed protein product [Adineta steineri]